MSGTRKNKSRLQSHFPYLKDKYVSTSDEDALTHNASLGNMGNLPFKRPCEGSKHP
jgi:hypothetical protein